MHSATHRRDKSKWKSTMTHNSFGCGSGTTERGLTRRFLARIRAQGTLDCMACGSVPKLWAGSWMSGVSSILVRRLS
jgi:hypothetical protein